MEPGSRQAEEARWKLLPARVAVGVPHDGKLTGVSVLLEPNPEETRIRWNGGNTIGFGIK